MLVLHDARRLPGTSELIHSAGLGESSVVVETEVTLKDYRAYIRFVQRYARSGGEAKSRSFLSWKFVMSAVAFGVLLGAIKIGAGLTMHWPSVALPFIVLFPVFFLFHRQAQDRLNPRPGGCILGHHTFSFADNGVTIQSQHIHTHLEWSGVRSIQDDGEHLYLLIDTCTGYILPKRCFPSKTAPDELQATVLKYVSPTLDAGTA